MLPEHAKETARCRNALAYLLRYISPSRGLWNQNLAVLDERQLRDIGVRTRSIAAMVDRDMSELLCRYLWLQGPKARP